MYRGSLSLIAFAVFTTCSRADISGTYIHKEAPQIAYMTVTQTGQKLTGYIQLVDRDPSKAEGFLVRQMPFTGQMSGGSFTAEGTFGLASGTAKGGGLTLHFPQANGQTSTTSFQRASAASWNTTVVAFENRCRSDARRELWKTSLRAHMNALSDRYQGLINSTTNFSNRIERDQKQIDDYIAERKIAEATAESRQREFDNARNAFRTAIQAIADAKAAYRENPTPENERKIGQCEVDAGRADAQVGGADTRLNGARSIVSQASDHVANANQTIRIDQQSLASVRTTLTHILAETSIWKDAKPDLDAMMKGALWTAIVVSATPIKEWPDSTSGVLSNCAARQTLSIVPFGPKWCAVMFENHAIGWTLRSALSIKRT
jgi:hypothetical protein